MISSALLLVPALFLLGSAKGDDAAAADAGSLADVKSPQDVDLAQARQDLMLKNAQLHDLSLERDILAERAHSAKHKLDLMEQEMEHMTGLTQRELIKSQQTFLDELSKSEGERLSLRDEVEKVKVEAEDPKLSKWLENRASSVGALVGDENSGKVFGHAVGDAYEDAVGSVKRLGETVEDVVEKKTGGPRFLAVVLSYMAFLFPAYAAWRMSTRVVNSLTFWQHLLAGHIFNSLVAGTALAMMVVASVDAVSVMWMSPATRVAIILFFVVQWFVLVSLMAVGIVTGSSKVATVGKSTRFAGSVNERGTFAFQLVLFLVMTWHVKTRGIPSIQLVADAKGHGLVNWKHYLLYLVASLLLALLTGMNSLKQGDKAGLTDYVSSTVENGVLQAKDVVSDITGSPKSSDRLPVLSDGAPCDGSSSKSE